MATTTANTAADPDEITTTATSEMIATGATIAATMTIRHDELVTDGETNARVRRIAAMTPASRPVNFVVSSDNRGRTDRTIASPTDGTPTAAASRTHAEASLSGND